MKTANTQTHSCTTKFTRSHLVFSLPRHFFVCWVCVCVCVCRCLQMYMQNITARASIDFIINVPPLEASTSLFFIQRQDDCFHVSVAQLFYKWDEAFFFVHVRSSLSPPNTHVPVNLNKSDKLFWCNILHKTCMQNIMARTIISFIRNTYLPISKQAQHILLSVSVIIYGPVHKWDR